MYCILVSILMILVVSIIIITRYISSRPKLFSRSRFRRHCPSIQLCDYDEADEATRENFLVCSAIYVCVTAAVDSFIQSIGKMHFSAGYKCSLPLGFYTSMTALLRQGRICILCIEEVFVDGMSRSISTPGNRVRVAVDVGNFQEFRLG
jgi:hypothetical protein